MGIPVDTRLSDLVSSEAPVIGQTPLCFARFAFDGATRPSTWWYWCDRDEAIALA